MIYKKAIGRLAMGERKPEKVVNCRVEAVEAALKASPSGIVLIFVQGHVDNPPGYLGASKIVGAFDHVAIALNHKGLTQLVEMRVGSDGLGALLSTNYREGSSLRALAGDYNKVKVMAIDISIFGRGADGKFKDQVFEDVKKPYGFLIAGLTCAALVHHGFWAARTNSFMGVTENMRDGVFDILTKFTFPLGWATQFTNTVTPLDNYEEGSRYSVPVAFYSADDIDGVIVHRVGEKVDPATLEVARKA